MRILIFNWRDIKNPLAGGAEVFIHENSKKCVQLGHKVTLFCSTFPKCLEKEEIDGVNIIRSGNRYTVYWQAIHHYRRYFWKDYDIVIDAINTIPFFTPLYVKKPKIALIFQLTGKIYFKELPKILAIFPYLLEPILFKILYRKITVLVLSESIRQELVNIGFSYNNITVVPPGIEYSTFKAEEKTNFPSIVYLNRLVKYKNVDDLINAIYILRKEIPNIRLFVSGCRGEKYEAYLRKLVKKLDLEKEVEFYPFLSGESKKKLLQKAWVHVLPSIKEGWGISVIEAAVCGTPTIGYDVSGLQDSVKNGETGFLVPYGKIEDLAMAIKRVLLDTDLRERLSANSIIYAKELSWDKSVQEIMKTIEKLLI